MSGSALGYVVQNIPMKNGTDITMFILSSFTNDADLEVLFLLFLTIYLFTFIGNLGLVIGDSRLHNSMYYFLSVLSFLDACYSTVVTPKILVNSLYKENPFHLLGV